MSTKDGRYTIIFNGTILNSPILRTQLENKGVRFLQIIQIQRFYYKF